MSDDSVELDYYDCLLRKSDVELLNETCWVNDNLIAFALEYFERDQFKSLTSDVAFIGPHVVQCVKFMSEEEVHAMLEPLGLHTKRLILIPVNDNSRADSIGGSHWSLIVYSKAERLCRHYDSMNQGNCEAAVSVWNKLKLYFKEHAKLTLADTPQQTNSCDCGVYVICIVESLCHEYQHTGVAVTSQASKTATATACTEVGEMDGSNVVLVSSITPGYVSKKRNDLKHLIRYLREMQQSTRPS